MADALLQHRGSGRQAFERARENDTRLTSVEAACGKSKRPVGSCGACRCRSAKAFWKRERPACASGSRPAIAFASGRRRCVSSRRSSWMAGSSSRWRSGCCWRAAGRGSCLVASCLVACVPTEGLARSFMADRDGEASDGKLMPNLIPRAAGHRGNATVDSGSAVLWSHATAAADSGRRSLRDSFSPGKPL